MLKKKTRTLIENKLENGCYTEKKYPAYTRFQQEIPSARKQQLSTVAIPGFQFGLYHFLISLSFIRVHQPCFIVMHKSVKSYPPQKSSSTPNYSIYINLHNSTLLEMHIEIAYKTVYFFKVVSQQCFNQLFCCKRHSVSLCLCENTCHECHVFFSQLP